MIMLLFYLRMGFMNTLSYVNPKVDVLDLHLLNEFVIKLELFLPLMIQLLF